jgi:hypothetical protein
VCAWERERWGGEEARSCFMPSLLPPQPPGRLEQNTQILTQAWRGDVPAIHALVAAGASVDLADGESGW